MNKAYKAGARVDGWRCAICLADFWHKYNTITRRTFAKFVAHGVLKHGRVPRLVHPSLQPTTPVRWQIGTANAGDTANSGWAYYGRWTSK